MGSELRTVVDTGVAVSAVLLPRSVPRRAFDSALTRGRLLVSAATVVELDEVFRRHRFNRYVPEEKRLEFLAALVREAEVVEVTEEITERRDPKDNKFLELAVSGKATHIISGDADLLVLHPFRGIAVLTPQDFLTSVEERGPEA
jgi:putative PIN family toxin of toxin-antitoxin system